MILLFVFVVVECIHSIGHGLFNTKVTCFLASYSLLFCIWSGVCPCTFFFFFWHFRDIDIDVSSIPKGLNNLDFFFWLFSNIEILKNSFHLLSSCLITHPDLSLKLLSFISDM